MSERDTRNRKNSFTIENNLSSLEVWAAVTSRAGCNSDRVYFSLFYSRKQKKALLKGAAGALKRKLYLVYRIDMSVNYVKVLIVTEQQHEL